MIVTLLTGLSGQLRTMGVPPIQDRHTAVLRIVTDPPEPESRPADPGTESATPCDSQPSAAGDRRSGGRPERVLGAIAPWRPAGLLAVSCAASAGLTPLLLALSAAR